MVRRTTSRNGHEPNVNTADRGLTDYLRALPAKLLSHAEEVELAQRIENVDQAAKRELIERNLRLVVYNAKSFRAGEWS